MKIFTCLCLILLITPLSASLQWQPDYATALRLSQQEGKPMLLFFNGSAGSGMKQEILETPAFEKRAVASFIFVEVDSQNKELRERFKVENFPALLILDKQERMITYLGYLPENADQLAEDLLEVVKQDAELTAGLNKLAESNLQRLYQLAQELGNAQAIEQIREEGLKKEDPYFLLEQYRFYVENGEMKSAPALALRQRLVGWGPELINGQSLPFTVALIDFQELLQNSPKSALAAEPLLEYLAGCKETHNRWQVERMIAEIYLNAGNCEEALRHAQRAYEAAPDSLQAELANSLDYIRKAACR